MVASFTPKQAARAFGVSESSLKRWCDRGVLSAGKTPGGHRWLPLSSVIDFVKSRGQTLVRPEAIGLPPGSGSGVTQLETAAVQLHQSFLAGEADHCRRILFDMVLSGYRASSICDHALIPAFSQIGEAWVCNKAKIYQEHRACEICVQLIHDLREILPPVAANAPLAIGGTPESDPYTLPTAMVEIVLKDAGWQANTVGRGLPLDSFTTAVHATRPNLCWLSVSSVDDEQEFIRILNKCVDSMQKLDIPVLIGGRAITSNVRSSVRTALHGQNMQELQTFAESLLAVMNCGKNNGSH